MATNTRYFSVVPRLNTFYKVERCGNTKKYTVLFPNAKVNIPLLARAGFQYVGLADEVRCPYCRIRVYDWEEDDDPIAYHIKKRPSCPYVNYCLL